MKNKQPISPDSGTHNISLQEVFREANPVMIPKALRQCFAEYSARSGKPHVSLLSLTGAVLDNSVATDKNGLLEYKDHFFHNLQVVAEETNIRQFHKLAEKMMDAFSADIILELLSEQAYNQMLFNDQFENWDYLCCNLGLACSYIEVEPFENFVSLCEAASGHIDPEWRESFIIKKTND